MRNWLIKIRSEAGLSQAKVAKAADIAQPYYCRLELGVKGTNLPVSTAKRIASVLNFDWTRFYDDIEG